MENVPPPRPDSETQSQSLRREQEQLQQAYLIAATLITDLVAAGKALARSFVVLLRWLMVTGAAIWILSRLQDGGAQSLDIIAIVILLTLDRRRAP